MPRTPFATLEFGLSDQPLTPAEQALFREDLETLGFGTSLWRVLNSSVGTRTRYSNPRWLRAFREGELVGVAFVVGFSRPGRCLFRSPRLAQAIDAPRVPQFIWNRLGAGIDQYSNPGFVRAGLGRSEFVTAALGFLGSRHLLGCVIEAAAAPARGPSATLSHLDYGVIDLHTAASADYFLARSKSLGRKLRKFRNKGGTLEVVLGAVSPPDLERIEGWLRGLEPEVRLSFQDNYPNMASRALGLGGTDTVHVLARLGGELAGYQSFVRCGDRLSCLSGLFDRTRSSTYHAYENIVLESVAYAAAHGVGRIDYGPVVNPTKAKLMTHFLPTELRYYSRFTPLRRSLVPLLRRSLLSPRNLGQYMGQEPVWLEAS